MQQPSHEKKDVETLSIPQRWAGLYTVILMLLLLAFFIFHQLKNTGFFTDKFGWTDMLALYGPILISLGPPIQRLIQGRRNPARPLEAATDLSLAVGSLWLKYNFPFEFAHLADPFPFAMRFAFGWITNDIARWILLLQVIIGFLSSASTITTYVRVRRKQSS
ncbi:MAG: hypothetical protein A2Z71_07595 [Chloroflexi bacterium RBG_13_50_21]|nr:MAG: hypothetical protein A2Z71_07595 [Chloroflexi bacterium RBG_13_50_21]